MPISEQQQAIVKQLQAGPVEPTTLDQIDAALNAPVKASSDKAAKSTFTDADLKTGPGGNPMIGGNGSTHIKL